MLHRRGPPLEVMVIGSNGECYIDDDILWQWWTMLHGRCSPMVVKENATPTVPSYGSDGECYIDDALPRYKWRVLHIRCPPMAVMENDTSTMPSIGSNGERYIDDALHWK